MDMSHIIPIMSLLIFLPSVSMAQSATENYMMTETMLDATGSASVKTVQYYNGLGFPTLSVTTAGGNSETAYTLTTYDGLGRESRKYVPVPGSSLDYVPESYIVSKGDFYGDNSCFTKNHYDVLDRITAVDIAGDEWRKTGKQNRTEYLTNVSSDKVLHYEAPEDGSYRLIQPEKTSYQYYPEGTLHKVVTYDADDKCVMMFKDMYDHKILERTAAGDTYYVYNVLGQLRFVLSPSYQTSKDEAIFAYEYRYDDMGRIIKKILPQCGAIQYWYDKADRVAYMKDPVLGSKYRFYLYDQFGRLCVQGTCTDGTRDVSILSGTTYTSGNGGICNTGYTVPYNIKDAKLEIANYYDNYDFMNNSLFSSMPVLTVSKEQEQYAIGSQTGTVVSTSNDERLVSCQLYDNKGQVVRSVCKGLNGIVEDVSTVYTFTGDIEKTTANVNVGYGGDFVTTTEYAYKCGKKTKMKLSLGHGNVSQPLETEYFYDAIGRLSKKSRQVSTAVKSDCSYSYDVHGWLRSIISGEFKESLYYADGFDGGCYNGNISTMKWMSCNDEEYRGYNFKYDGSNRLRRSFYGTGDSLANNRNNFNEFVEYDSNGNATALLRYGLLDDTRNFFTYVDDLDMTYDGNRLISIRDKAYQVLYEGSEDFKGKKGKEYPLTYNDAGSLVSDVSRKIAKIDYDDLNNPIRIQFTDGNVTKYIYSATGEKLRVIYQTAVPNLSVAVGTTKELLPSEILYTENVDYLLGGVLTLKNGRIDKYQFEDGYCQAVRNSENANMDEFSFYYYDFDHLGNVRQVTEADANPKGRVVQTNNYYPFGMLFCDGTKNYLDQKHKYNGKEFDNMYGLNTYDYGARQYNPVTLRWDRIDPMAEEHYNVSSYVYCCNNPITYYDYGGLDSVYYNEAGVEIQRRLCDKSYNFVIRTSQTTADMYGESNSAQKGNSNPISREVAMKVETEIRKGNLTGAHMKNVVQLGNDSEMYAMLASIKDDGTGGTKSKNNREYSGMFTASGVMKTKTGAVGDPSKNKCLVSTDNPDFHSHPSGTKPYKEGYSFAWQQPPSKQDIMTAKHAGYVIGCRNGVIYKYNKYGVIATCPAYIFK